MPKDLIRYDLLVQDALCGVVKKVLSDVAKYGLPGDHHFYITFRTHAPGVRLSTRMKDLYPEEMTIILQHQFEDLRVTDHALEVGLSFKGVPEILLIPFDAVTGFFDPSVQFSAKFDAQSERDDEVEDAPEQAAPVTAPTPVASLVSAVPQNRGLSEVGKPPREPAVAGDVAEDEPTKVVSIDAFRKKP
jgi:uncharacterized protein